MSRFVVVVFVMLPFFQNCWLQEEGEYDYSDYYDNEGQGAGDYNGNYDDYYGNYDYGNGSYDDYYGNYNYGNGSNDDYYDNYNYGNGSNGDYYGNYNYGNGSYDDYYGNYGNESYDDLYDNSYDYEEPGPETASFTDCGGELTILPTSGIKTPNYPTEEDTQSVYPNNAYCKWWFNGDNSTLVRFKMWDLVVEIGEGDSNVTCDFDYINVTITSLGSRRFCGYKASDEELRGLGSLTIIFVSDDSTNFRGMQSSYQILENHDPCDPSPCSQQGKCETLSDLMSIQCNCDPGYSGQRCETNTRECSSNPCLNGGKCDESKKPDYYKCICPVKYEGIHCEIKILNPCIPSPCQNGGICTNHTETTYSCNCTDHYRGNNCEIENFPPCFSSPCKNKGVCLDFLEETKYILIPSPDKPGKKIQVEAPPDYSGFNCTCSDKYRGSLCEIETGCSNPGIPDLEKGYWFDPDATVSFSCIDGYILVGSVNSTCHADGTWSTPVPDCTANSTTGASTGGPGAPWVGAMAALGGAFTINLIAFASWMIVKGPWKKVNRIINISQSSLKCGSDIEEDSSTYDSDEEDEDETTSSGSQSYSESGSSIGNIP